MAFRQSISNNLSKSIFIKTANKTNSKNVGLDLMRGGYRL